MSLRMYQMSKCAVILLMVATIGCAGSFRSRLDATIPVISESWFTLQDSLLQLHKAGFLMGEKWERTKELQSQASTVIRRIWEGWRTVSEVEFKADYAELLLLIRQLREIVSSAGTPDAALGPLNALEQEAETMEVVYAR